MDYVQTVENAVRNLGDTPRPEALREVRGHYLWRAWKDRHEPGGKASWVRLARITHALLMNRPAAGL